MADIVREHPYHDYVGETKEKVHHPDHYGGDTTYEAIKVIEAWGLNFCLGNALKYICRADKHGTRLDDLKKAAWYLNHEVENMEKLDKSGRVSTQATVLDKTD